MEQPCDWSLVDQKHGSGSRDKFGILVWVRGFNLVNHPLTGYRQGSCCRSCTICFLGHRAQRIWICHGGSFTGYLFCTITKERVEETLNQVRNQIPTDMRRTGSPPDFFNIRHSDEACELLPNMPIGDFEKDSVSKFFSCDQSISMLS